VTINYVIGGKEIVK